MLIVLPFVLLASAATVFIRRGGNVLARLAISAGALVAGILSITWVALNRITGAGINDAVFYHLDAGLEGAGVSEYSGMIAAVVSGLVVLGYGCFRLFRALSSKAGPARRLVGDALAIVLVLASVLSNPLTIDLARYANRFSSVVQQTEGFTLPQPGAIPAKKKNLVLIYLESTERTYFDENIFPGLITDLRGIEAQGTSFTGLTQTMGASFTIGGMVASQCGVPLLLSGSENSMHVSHFLTGATCLGDMLSADGYQLDYMGGSALEFAGKGSFYASHGFDRVSGLAELQPKLSDPAYLGPWGLQDDSLYAMAQARIAELAAGDAPFALVMLTLDTHHPDGHANTNKACQDVRYQDGSNQMLTSVKCADKLAAAFITALRNSPLAKDTIIAVASDHLAMVNGAATELAMTDRRNLFFVIDPSQPEPKQITRPGTTLDIAPTLMTMLGYDVPMMGFGVDLLRQAPTVAETYPDAESVNNGFSNYILGFESVFQKLWEYPSIADGVYVNVEGRKAQFGDVAVAIPAVFDLDADAAIQTITINDPAAEKSLAQFVLETPGDPARLWLDRCATLSPLAVAATVPKPDDLCLLSGAMGSAGMSVQVIEESTHFAGAELVAMLQGQADPALLESRNAALQDVVRANGGLPVDVPFAVPDYTGRDVLMRSSAAGMGASYLRVLTTDTLDSGADTLVDRGLTLAGITMNGTVQVLATVDTCEPSAEDSAVTPEFFKGLMQDDAGFAAFVIQAHDSAVCDADPAILTRSVEGLALPMLKTLGRRQPYVAVFPKGETASETLGMAGRSLLVRMKQGAVLAKAVPAIEPAPAPTPVAASTQTCIVPDTTPAAAAGQEPMTAGEIVLLEKTRAAGGVVPGKGWWSAEPFGRWIGSENSELSLVLPVLDGKLELEFLGQPYRQAEAMVQVRLADRVLFDGKLKSLEPLRIDVTDVARGVPVALTVLFPGAGGRCPQSVGTAGDARSLVAMIHSVRLIAEASATVTVASKPAAALAPQDVIAVKMTQSVPAPACISPATASASTAPAEALAATAKNWLGGPTAATLFGNGPGWWDAEPFGRWIGDARAEISVILPQGSGPLALQIAGTAYLAKTVDLEVTYLGKPLGAGQLGAESAVKVDATALPREQPVTLTLSFPQAPVACPQSVGDGSDLRRLVAMIESVEVIAEQVAAVSLLHKASVRLPLVAHAGGAVNNIAITDSLDALTANAPDYDLFEIDLNWTEDRQLVCLHDWEASFEFRFGFRPGAPLTLASFRELLTKTASHGPQNCTLETLVDWLKAHPSKRVVTDVKADNLEALALISGRFPEIMPQIIPQAYQPAEVAALHDMGYADVIWTLYAFGGTEAETLAALDGMRIFALTMPEAMAQTGLARKVAAQYGIPAYVHTINVPKVAQCYAALGVAGFYTDRLIESDLAAPGMAGDCEQVLAARQSAEEKA